MARRTKDDAEKTRDALLDAAENLFYVCGVSRTSLEQIAVAAGVTRGAVYWHFKDKLELCDAMARRVFLPHEDMLEKLAAESDATETPLDDLKKSCLHSLKMIARDKRRQKVVTILLMRCEYVDDLVGIMERNKECKHRMLMLSEKLFARARALKILAPAWTPRQAAVATQALMTGLIAGCLEKRKNFNLVPVGTSCVEAFFDSLQAKGRRHA